MNRSLTLLALASILLLAFAGTAAAKRETVRAGNLYLSDDGGISPSTLPRHGGAPISAHLIGEIGTADGSHPPALRTVDVEVDRTIGIDAVGLPVCRAKQIEAQDTAAAKRACGEATVGTGSAEVAVSFPEQAPFSAIGPVTLFNGGVHGATTLILLHAYVAVPAPTAIVTRATVTRIHRDRYGLEIEATIPRIAGGAGSVTKFSIEVGRRYTYKGRQKSLLTASCPTGTWMTRGEVLFSDQTRLGVTHPFACTPRG